MGREYKKEPSFNQQQEHEFRRALQFFGASVLCSFFVLSLPGSFFSSLVIFILLGSVVGASIGWFGFVVGKHTLIEIERKSESKRRGGLPVLGAPPKRSAFNERLKSCLKRGKKVIDGYLVGFSLERGEPLWVSDNDICTHACVFAKTGVGKTAWLTSLMLQHILRGRGAGCTFIDAKRDTTTLAQVILLALVSGRIEDLIVIDPFNPIHAYNFVLTNQKPDVKARKVLRAGLPPTSDQSVTKHYDRLAADSIYRLVRAVESIGSAWSAYDIAVALSAFSIAYPYLTKILKKKGAKRGLVELGHLAASYRTSKGNLDTTRLTDNLRGIASELHSISSGAIGEVFCKPYTDLELTDAILQGKIIYFMLPRLEEAESAARMVKVFREDLEVSIGEITSSEEHYLEDPHLIIIDEGSSTFGPTWANLFELARKGRFALIFGAQSTGGLTDPTLGLSRAFYERVMANVNLKVMMRVGDNTTAKEMSEWLGKVASARKSYGAGLSSGVSQNAGLFDSKTRKSGGETRTFTVSETEEYLVSAEELKHEMSSEKGLAWFDLGNGRIEKGRTLWVDVEVPIGWNGREHLVRYERVEKDELGLGDWVNEAILEAEKQKSAKEYEKFVNGEEKSKEASVGEEEVKGEERGEEKEKRKQGIFSLFKKKESYRYKKGLVTTVSSKTEEEKGEVNKGKKELTNTSLSKWRTRASKKIQNS
ncbi:MAG: hypothetical protein D6822_06955 [Cyanobacteria bacterium J149]|nr:MAG: hypothetical protein D6822_06955 [Cyanobacteria bacterium J149]